MRKLIVHIEYDENEMEALAIQETLDQTLDRFRLKFQPCYHDEGRDIGWRFFDSLDGAMDWEMAEPDIEVALRLVGHLRRMIGKIAEGGMK